MDSSSVGNTVNAPSKVQTKKCFFPVLRVHNSVCHHSTIVRKRTGVKVKLQGLRQKDEKITNVY